MMGTFRLLGSLNENGGQVHAYQIPKEKGIFQGDCEEKPDTTEVVLGCLKDMNRNM